MKRRRLLLAGGAFLAACAAPAFSQARPRRVALLHPSSPSPAIDVSLAAFRDEFHRLGYREGRDFTVEVSWADGQTERLPALAADLVAKKPEVIVTASSAAVAALRKATSSIPIVFATASNPVEQGFVTSLQRPGGNVTGVILYADRMTQKVMEIAREVFPAARRLGLLIHEPDPVSRFELKAFDGAARSLRFDPVIVRMASVQDFDRAFEELAAGKAEAVIMPQLAFFQNYRKEVVARALKARLPVLGADLRYVEAGALMGYGTVVEENYRRAAAMVDKILRGAKVSEIPVEQPERFRLVLNARTAKAIGVTFPAVMTMRADRVID
jgi:putative tryptophan/tyrosine transport system substrate-binding protein